MLDLGSGLRRGELLALQWQDVDLIEGVVKINRSLSRVRVDNDVKKSALKFQPLKTKKSQRSIPLPEVILVELRKHKAKQNQEKLKVGTAYNDQGLVFCSEIGNPVDPRNFNRKFYQLLKTAGLERTNPHSLRHTFATRLLELNEHPKVVQELLGHASVGLTLDTYSHVMPEVKQAAAERLNKVFITKSPSIKEGYK